MVKISLRFQTRLTPCFQLTDTFKCHFWILIVLIANLPETKANWWLLGLSGVHHPSTTSSASALIHAYDDVRPSLDSSNGAFVPSFEANDNRLDIAFGFNQSKWSLLNPNAFDHGHTNRRHKVTQLQSKQSKPSKQSKLSNQRETSFTISNRQLAQQFCRQLPGLTESQLKLCESNPDLMTAVSQGAKMGIAECKQQFQHERWNCTSEGDQHVFGRTLARGSRETAFVHAITSAGVVYAVTQSCSSGQLIECGCDRKYAVNSKMKLNADLLQAIEEQEMLEGSTNNLNAATSRTLWRWGGCSDNVGFGVAFARRFVDAPEVSNSHRSIRAVMNLHNNKAGREAIKRRMRLKCRCHGVSGSCELKTCWRTLPEFELIGADLKSKYEQSVPISGLVGRRSISAQRKRRQGRGKLPPLDVPAVELVSTLDQSRPTKEDLVHISKSPNYCVQDRHNGILGTSGRQCEVNSNGPDSCDLLCCGRGYHTRILRKLEQCQCKFEWCCHVTCSTCKQLVQVHTCK